MSLMSMFYFAVSPVIDSQCPANNDCSTNIPHITADPSVTTTILNWAFGAAAAIAVIIIIISGLRLIYAAKDGDSNAVSHLRNTIIMSGIGLVVVLTADAIVAFVAGRI